MKDHKMAIFVAGRLRKFSLFVYFNVIVAVKSHDLMTAAHKWREALAINWHLVSRGGKKLARALSESDTC